MIAPELLESRLDQLHDEERVELIRLGQAILDGRPGVTHRRRLAEVRIEIDGTFIAQRLSRASGS